MLVPVPVRRLACLAVAAAAACGAPAGPTITDPVAAIAEPPAPRDPFVVARADAIHALTRDATHLYWSSGDGIHRRPLGADGEVALVVGYGDAIGAATALAAGDGRVFASEGTTVYAIPATGGAPAKLVEASGDVTVLLVDGDDLFVATSDTLLRVPVAGGAPATLATGQAGILSLAATDEHVYWTTYGGGRASAPTAPGAPLHPAYVHGEPTGAVRRVLRAGGAVEEVAGAQRGPIGVTVARDRVWWCNEHGPALQSAPLGAGGDRRVEEPGRANGCAVDGRGAIVRTSAGMVFERAAAGEDLPDVRLLPSDAWHPIDARPPVVDDDWVYVVAQRWFDGERAVIALPRQDEPVDVVALTDDTQVRIDVDRGVLYAAGSDRDTGEISLWAVDTRTGARRDLGRHGGWLNEIEVGGGHVYFAEDTLIYRVPVRGGRIERFAMADGWVTGLSVHRNHVFWVDGTVLRAKPRGAGRPIAVAHAPYGPGYGGGLAGLDLVFDDDHVYLTSFGSSALGLYRISERGEVELVWSAGVEYGLGPDLVEIGDEMFVTLEYAVHRIDRDGDATRIATAPSGGYIHELAGGAGLLYLRSSYGEWTELTRIDPATGDSRPALRWLQSYSGELPEQLVVDDDAAYTVIEAAGAILRVGHGATASPLR